MAFPLNKTAWELAISILLSVVCHFAAPAGTSGSCVVNDFQTQKDFSLTKFLGKWYEMKWLPQSFVPVDKRFSNFKIDLVEKDGGNITVHVAGRKSDGECVFYDDYIYKMDTPAKLRIKTKLNDHVSDYWVMSTDYETFTVVYGCRKENQTSGTCETADAWMLSRQQTLSDQQVAKADAILGNLCVNIDDFITTKHDKECNPSGASSNIQLLTHLIALCSVVRFATNVFSDFW